MRRAFPLLIIVALLAGCSTSRSSEGAPHSGAASATSISLADEPPYPRFKGNSEDSSEGYSFEPSAVAYNENTQEVIVLNDKDSILYRYKHEWNQESKVMSLAREAPRLLTLSNEEAAKKFESLTPLGGGDFLAATAFDRTNKEFNHVVRFRLAEMDGLKEMGPVKAELVNVALDNLAAAIRDLSEKSGGWFKIEGLTTDESAEHVFFGVRQVGVDYKQPKDVVFVVRCPFSKEKNEISSPDATFRFLTEKLGEAQGLSDIQRAQDGGYFILTSREEIDDMGEPELKPSSHAGALFRVDAKILEGASSDAPLSLGDPITRFRAKSEGLAVLPENRLLIVFDDDREWKKLFRTYEQSEGLFTVFDLN